MINLLINDLSMNDLSMNDLSMNDISHNNIINPFINQIVHNLYWGPIHPGLPFSTHFFLVDKRAVSIFELINFMFWCFLFSERDGRKVIYICYLYRHLDQI